MDLFSYLLGKKSGGGGNITLDGSLTYDSSKLLQSLIVEVKPFDLGNNIDMSSFFKNCAKLKVVPMLDTSKIKSMSNCFMSCAMIETMPLWDTHLVTAMSNMFSGCAELKNVPVLDTSSLLTASNTFSSCNKLTDESLDNILQMCANATLFSGTKTLYALGFRKTTYTQAKIEGLSNYADFVAAGWSTGY